MTRGAWIKSKKLEFKSRIMARGDVYKENKKIIVGYIYRGGKC
jgi:hypothetical protein